MSVLKSRKNESRTGCSRPDVHPGDTSAWYAHFWDFVYAYLTEQFGTDYCLSAENSLDLHVGNPTVPKQVVVITKKGGGKPIHLPFATSILAYSDLKNFPSERSVVRGLQVMSLPLALVRVSPTYFQKNSTDAQIALSLIDNLSELIFVIATHRFIRGAERIVGGYEAVQQFEKATVIQQELKKLGIPIRGTNPFTSTPSPIGSFRSPYAARIVQLWESLRNSVIGHFPEPRGSSVQTDSLDILYPWDAYNSLSIEGYHVSPALIERVRNHEWNPDLNPEDNHERNALAARGYYEAFTAAKAGIAQILDGTNPGVLIEKELQNWFQKLFGPNVQAGILKPLDLVGYRKHQVYIRNSRHVPLPKEALMDAMEAFFNCLKRELHPAVRAILGHCIFVYIHPFMDGNGRLGRFIMNTMLVSGGYPWLIIPVSKRTEYFAALEQVSVEHDICPFTVFLRELLESSLP